MSRQQGEALRRIIEIALENDLSVKVESVAEPEREINFLEELSEYDTPDWITISK